MGVVVGGACLKIFSQNPPLALSASIHVWTGILFSPKALRVFLQNVRQLQWPRHPQQLPRRRDFNQDLSLLTLALMRSLKIDRV